MSSDQISREGRPADVRPKWRAQPPAWLEDYGVSLPHYDQTSPAVRTMPPPTEIQEPYHRHERVAEKTPLIINSLIFQPDLRQRQFTHSEICESTPVPHYSISGDVCSEILEAIQQLRTENQKLQSTVLNMQRQMDQRPTPPSHDRAPSQPWQLPQASLSHSEHQADRYQFQPPREVSRASIPYEEEDNSRKWI